MKLTELHNVDILGHLSIPLSNEEKTLITKGEIINSKQLSERENRLAQALVTRGVFTRLKKKGVIYYKVNNGV